MREVERKMRMQVTRSTRVARMQVTTITVNLKHEGKVIPKWSLVFIVDVPKVAEEEEGDDGDGNEAEGEVPPQLH